VVIAALAIEVLAEVADAVYFGRLVRAKCEVDHDFPWHSQIRRHDTLAFSVFGD
jgi:hypothetical protein